MRNYWKLAPASKRLKTTGVAEFSLRSCGPVMLEIADGLGQIAARLIRHRFQGTAGDIGMRCMLYSSIP